MIGANGAGKSTFLKPALGRAGLHQAAPISIKPGPAHVRPEVRTSTAYDAYTVLDTVIMGNQRLYDVMKQKDALYAKPDFSDEDGLRGLGAGGGVRGAERLGG